MLSSITFMFATLVALGFALRPGRSDGLITRRPYNNRYNDASGAREDHLG